MAYKLGIDVGGTNTDAVILDHWNNLLGAAKAPTTPDVGTGILESLDEVLLQSGIDPAEITQTMLGTTHCTNAVIERKRLARIAVIRIGRPAGTAVDPLFTWPLELLQAVGGHWYIVNGGFELDGRQISRGLDYAEVSSVLDDIQRREVESVAVSCIFSPVRSDHERLLAEAIRDRLGPGVAVTLSSDIGSLGLLERENSAALNAALVNVVRNAAEGLEQALAARKIRARIFFSQNDGTLMSLDYARRCPILTIGSGPSNSIRGAAFLTGMQDCAVIDVGGTSTDIGILVKGFPRHSPVAVEIGGVRTNFRMPDIISVGLGGGSVIRETAEGVEVGPDSVGYQLTQKALAWGGDTATITDAMLAMGMGTVSDRRAMVDRVRHLNPEACRQAIQAFTERVERALDRVKADASPVPVVLVGGGSILLPNLIGGFSQVIRPVNYQYANAIGAAIAQVSGKVDRMWTLAHLSRQEAVSQAKQEATRDAIRAGADPSTLEVVDVEEIPLAYLPSDVVRIRVKAVGSLRAEGATAREEVMGRRTSGL